MEMNFLKSSFRDFNFTVRHKALPWTHGAHEMAL